MARNDFGPVRTTAKTKARSSGDRRTTSLSSLLLNGQKFVETFFTKKPVRPGKDSHILISHFSFFNSSPKKSITNNDLGLSAELWGWLLEEVGHQFLQFADRFARIQMLRIKREKRLDKTDSIGQRRQEPDNRLY